MIKYKKYLDQFGWPIKTTPNFKIKKKYESKIFFFSKLKRKFDICLKIPSFELIDGYYGDNFLGSHYLDNLRKISLFKTMNIQINFELFSKLIFYILKKRVIKLKENEICLFGPYSQNYCHVIQEFFVRLIFLSDKKDPSIIWLPDNLKKYLISDPYKKTFSNMKFKFYPTDKNLIFLNCNYLSHSNSRWLIINGKKIKIVSPFQMIIESKEQEEMNLYVRGREIPLFYIFPLIELIKFLNSGKTIEVNQFQEQLSNDIDRISEKKIN